jgi:acyl carrier protein
MNEIKIKVKEFIRENFLINDDMALDDSQSLLESGVLDSTSVLELLAFLEETFDITIDDEEIVPENLDSIQNIVQFVESKKVSVGN